MREEYTMDKSNRRSLLKGRLRLPTATPLVSGGPEAPALEGTSRRAFLEGTAGAAAGAAVILATPKVATVAMDVVSPGRTADPSGGGDTALGPSPV
jgi:hypothetical protein